MRRVRIAIAAGIGAMVLSTAAAAQSVPPIPDRNSTPSISAGPDGDLHVVWIEGAIGEQTIFYSRRVGASWSSRETVVAGVSTFAPVVLVRPDGVPCVLWTLIALSESCREDGEWSSPTEIAREAAASDFVPVYGSDGVLRVVHLEPPNSIHFGVVQLNPADEIITFPAFTIDSDGGFHAFWYDFTEDRGWVWSYSTDAGVTWAPFESLSLSLPQSSGTLVGADADGGVYSVLVNAFSIEYRRWTAISGWSDTEVMETTLGAIDGALAVAAGGGITVATATGEGAQLFSHSPGGPWREEGFVAGTEGRSIDSVVAAPEEDARATVLWHEFGAVGFNQARIGSESLVASVPSITDLNLDPIVVATSLAVTAGVVFLVPFPAEIFNNTVINHHEEIRRWFRRRRENNEARRFWDRPAGLVVFVVVSALLFGFLDPSFGPNGASVAVFIGLLVGVVVTTLGFALPTLILRRARSKEWGRLRALPIALIVGVGCVVLSRIIGFVPGYLYGIVLGLAFTREVSEQDEAREVAVSAVVLLAVAILSWVALGAVRSGVGTGFAVDVGEAALATITVAAFEALTIGLLPLRGMPGRTLFANRKTWWIVIWGIAVLAFFHALVNPQSGYLSESTLVPVATTVALLVVFAAISVGMWGFFALKDRKKA
jgi:hypothetical protein